MRITHVNLARGYRGGERQTELLIRELAARGLEQRLIARRDQPLGHRLVAMPPSGGAFKLCPVSKPFVRHVGDARNAILHAHDSHGAKFAALAHLIFGNPYLLTRRIGKRPSGNRLTRYVYLHADALVAVAGSVAGGLSNYTDRADVRVIYSALSDLPIDADRAAELRQQWSDAFVVVNVAALVDSQKGQSNLIEAARRAAAEYRDLHFVLVGEGRDRCTLIQRAADLDNVEFTGFVDNVGDYLAAADAFVLPSNHEGIGGAALDAMRAGLPVIASDVDGLPEFIDHERNGLLIPPGDAQALLDAILRLRADRAASARMAMAGQETSMDFSIVRMADGYQALYRELTGSSPARTRSNVSHD